MWKCVDGFGGGANEWEELDAVAEILCRGLLRVAIFFSRRSDRREMLSAKGAGRGGGPHPADSVRNAEVLYG